MFLTFQQSLMFVEFFQLKKTLHKAIFTILFKLDPDPNLKSSWNRIRIEQNECGSTALGTGTVLKLMLVRDMEITVSFFKNMDLDPEGHRIQIHYGSGTLDLL